VGIDITLNFSAKGRSFSQSTEQQRTSSFSIANWSKIGANDLQGPHHEAQNLINTGLSVELTIFSKFSNVSSISNSL
jgi:hypothetical protein